MSKRYEITSNWREVERVTTGPEFTDENYSVTVTREVADIRDKVNGWEYAEGAYRVGAVHPLSGKSHTRSRTFYGESAWSNSARQYGDIVNAVRFSQ